MKINDQRETCNNLVCFKELSIGDVYEDENGYICIKTTYADGIGEINCITFQNYGWNAYYEDPNLKVVRVEAELILRRNR